MAGRIRSGRAAAKRAKPVALTLDEAAALTMVAPHSGLPVEVRRRMIEGQSLGPAARAAAKVLIQRVDAKEQPGDTPTVKGILRWNSQFKSATPKPAKSKGAKSIRFASIDDFIS